MQKSIPMPRQRDLHDSATGEGINIFQDEENHAVRVIDFDFGTVEVNQVEDFGRRHEGGDFDFFAVHEFIISKETGFGDSFRADEGKGMVGDLGAVVAFGQACGL